MNTIADQKHIYLIGFSGSGKSTLGPKLAKQLRYGFIDLDDMIESSTMQNISQIFAEQGERHFRKLESDLITMVAKRKKPHVVALGGGAFEKAANRRTLLATGIVIYLSCSIKELTRRVLNHEDRPMLKEKEDRTEQSLEKRISELLAKRKPNYMMAHITVSTTNRTESAVLKEVLLHLKKHADR
jgi:shikimate kinase